MVAAQHVVVLLCCTLLAGAAAVKVVKDVTSLQIGVKHRPKDCTVKTKTGDSVSMHYTGEPMRAWVARHLAPVSGCASRCTCCPTAYELLRSVMECRISDRR